MEQVGNTILHRFIELFDSVINLVIPDWSEDCTNICNFKVQYIDHVLTLKESDGQGLLFN